MTAPENARIEKLKKTVSDIETRGSPEDLCRAIIDLGMALTDEGRIDDAVENVERGLAIMEKHQNTGAQVSILGMLGVLYARAGKPRVSSDKFIAALKLMEDLSPSVDEQLHCLMGIGRNLVALGDFQAAITQYTEAEKLARRRVLPQEELDAIASKIVLHEQRGEFREVIRLYKRSIALFRLLGDHEGKIAMLRGLASAYGKLGEKEEAGKYMKMWDEERTKPSQRSADIPESD